MFVNYFFIPFLAPEDHYSLGNRSHVYQKQGKYKQALEDANAAIALRKDWGKGYFRRGLCLHGMGRYEEAFKSFYECLSIEMACGGVEPNSKLCPSLTECTNELYCVIERLVRFKKHYKHTRNQQNEPNKDSLVNSTSNNEYIASASSTPCLFTIGCSSPKEEKGYANSTNNDPSLKNLDTYDDSYLGTYDDSSPNDSEDLSGSEDDHITGSLPMNVRKLTPEFMKDFVDYVSILHENTDNLDVVGKPKEEWYVRGLLSYRAPYRPIDPDAVDSADYECSLCMRLLWQPITTPCGHTFCRVCLDRALDHNGVCPICKSPEVKKVYLIERREFVPDEFIESSMRRLIPNDYQERKALQQQEVNEFGGGTENADVIPIFVCTVSIPGVPCPLHVFEPRYRLMIRRAMESGTREFGMAVKVDDHP